MSSKTIKLILAVLIGIPVALAAITFAAVLALRLGSSTDVATPVEISGSAEPIRLLGDIDSATKVSEPTNGAIVPQLDPSRLIQRETVKHLATASGSHGDFDLFVHDDLVIDIETNRETIEHCIKSYEATEAVLGGGMCSPEEFTEPQYFQFNSTSPGSTEVALFYAEAGAQTMTIETQSGYVVSSNLVNGAGFVQYDLANGQPKWISLYDSDGLAIWSQQIL